MTLVGGYKDSGEAVYENVLVTYLSSNEIRLVKTPGIVLGVAAGDVLQIDGNGEFSVKERAGNVAVQIYGDPGVARSLESDIEALGSRWDGALETLTIYTIPASAGFRSIELVPNALMSKDSTLEWYYGNVYDSADGVTPLNWWVTR